MFLRYQDKISLQLSSILEQLSILDLERDQTRCLIEHSSAHEDTLRSHIPQEDNVGSHFHLGGVSTTAKGAYSSEFSETIGHQSIESRATTGRPRITKSSEPGSPSRKHRCLSWCNCSCHVIKNYHLPWLINFLLGELKIRYSDQQKGAGCHCLGSPKLHIIYQLPSLLAQRYVFIAMHYSYMAGPEFILRMPRRVSWSHLLWRYSINEDLSAIRKLYSEGLASPYDVDARGLNALMYVVKRDKPDIVQFMLNQGVDIEMPTKIGQTPRGLFLALFIRI